MTEYHVRQFDGGSTACDSRNCACASCSMAMAFATAGAELLTSDEVRKESGRSCIPGVDSPSGGLFISDVERVAKAHGVRIDYHRDRQGRLRPWTTSEAKRKLSTRYGAIFLGDYDQVPAPTRAPGSTFKGDHSLFAHDYRASDDTVCWHDPLRRTRIRAPWSTLVAYWQKKGSPVRGLAGFVEIPDELPDTSTEDEMDTYSIAGNQSAIWPAGSAIHDKAGKKIGVTPVARRYQVVAQDAPKGQQKFYLCDGAEERDPLLMRWLVAREATSGSWLDETFNAGVAAATRAAGEARRP